jgi:hypothetical protein
LVEEQGVDVLGVNTSGCQLIAIPRFREVRLAPQPHRSDFNGVFERQMLECVEGVVVNKDADWTLCWQQMRETSDRLCQVIRRMGHRYTYEY